MFALPFPVDFLPILAVWLTLLLVIAFAVSADARARDVRFAAVLGAVTAVFGPVALVYYLTRGSYGPREYPPSRWERTAWTLLLAVTGSFVLAATLAPPDPFTQSLYAGGSLLLSLPLAYLVVFRDLWGRVRAELR
ncbi:hypothetical protein SAMN04487948_10947 [Halogranum amylolyticum]|uniref:Uncharacterized protein n=1 Tax=Halogranum amylolyticum TaxID=660520 RepID=A0A1H8U0C9_9EURY|nr:hypothetical protein [Halogranum amylolyticum]SEO96712.1 hypothetical protein SAMN04487948_10947 [Halogranum amylolyticum]